MEKDDLNRSLMNCRHGVLWLQCSPLDIGLPWNSPASSKHNQVISSTPCLCRYKILNSQHAFSQKLRLLNLFPGVTKNLLKIKVAAQEGQSEYVSGVRDIEPYSASQLWCLYQRIFHLSNTSSSRIYQPKAICPIFCLWRRGFLRLRLFGRNQYQY